MLRGFAIVRPGFIKHEHHQNQIESLNDVTYHLFTREVYLNILYIITHLKQIPNFTVKLMCKNGYRLLFCVIYCITMHTVFFRCFLINH